MLPVAGHSDCSRVNGRLGPVDERSMVCAGGQGKGGCQVYRTKYNTLSCALLRFGWKQGPIIRFSFHKVYNFVTLKGDKAS